MPYLRIRRGRRAASRNEAIGKRKGLGLTPCPLTENPCEPRGGSGGFVCGEGECSAKSRAQAGGAVLRWGASSAGGTGGEDRLAKAQPWTVKAVARERNGCLIPRYTGEGAVALNALARFHWQTAAEAVSPDCAKPARAPTAGFLFAKTP